MWRLGLAELTARIHRFVGGQVVFPCGHCFQCDNCFGVCQDNAAERVDKSIGTNFDDDPADSSGERTGRPTGERMRGSRMRATKMRSST